MLLAITILILISSVCVGWRIGARRPAFTYRKLDAEMSALRAAIEQNHPHGQGA
jgi:hypothetical protein